jgi:asparagine synthase (glutamine-hydrolysing)
MCGICGIVNFNATEPVNRRLVEAMTDVQAHRGPDGYGYFLEGNVGFGHRRLSIIDLGGGKQPMYNEDESVVIVFNGEVYNFADITSRLVSLGHRFRTRSDTEAIVHAYEEYGDDCVKEFRGMFAFAIWDRRQKRLLLSRDRLGIKPLYYYASNKFLAFASEIKSLLQHPLVEREIDPQAVDLYLALRYVPGPRTMFKNIFKLQPGHSLTLDATGIHIRQFWDVEYTQTSFSELDCVEMFKQLLEESVRLRLISDVPLGVFLSGGLDSSAMLAMMSRITGRQRIKAFSVGYEVSGPSARETERANEFSYARLAADHFGAEHHEYRINPPQFRDAVGTLVSHLDEPMADPTCIPLYFISKVAREHITVVLSGEGADETMAGYALYRRVLALDRIRRRLGPLASMIPAIGYLPLGDRLRAYVRRAATPLEVHYRGVVKGLSLETRLALIGEERLWKSDERLDETFRACFKRVENASALNRMLYADAKVWLPEDLLLKADKTTMAASIELRVPFLDHKLVEFCAMLPDSLKIRGGNGKWILRRAMRTELPPSIIQRKKKGFPSPAAGWLRFELRDFVRDTLLASSSACGQFFDPGAIEDIVGRHERGEFSGFQEVWSLIVFEVWHRHFIEDFTPVRVPDAETVAVRMGPQLAQELPQTH